jgi:2'-5' RNA ligase
VEEATLPLGFAPELRPFNPHLTLARLQEDVGPTDRRVFGTAMMTAPVSTGPFVDGRVVSLMRSELSRGGPTYSRIAAIPVL